MSRSASAAVDAGIVAVLLGAGYFGVAAALLLWDPRSAHLPDVPRATLVLAAALIAVGYLTASWATTGRTLGGQLLGLRVVDARGTRLHWMRALLRSLLCTAFPLGLLWASMGRSRRSVADLLVRTTVVYDWGSHPPPSWGDDVGLKPGEERRASP